MPKRVGYLYDKMVDRDFIRSVIQEAAKGRRNRRDIARVLADLDGYVEKTYELVATESFVPSAPKVREIYDESSEKYRKMVEKIGEKLHFTSLHYHRLDDMMESVGIDADCLCTYCWNGKE